MTKEQIINFCESNNFDRLNIKGTKEKFRAYAKEGLMLSVSHYYPCDRDIIVSLKNGSVCFFNSQDTEFVDFESFVLSQLQK